LQELNERFAEMEQEILDQAGGELTAEQKAKLRELRQQKRAALRELLTPAELAEYDARASSTTQELRRRMGAFNATEEEFRTIYRLQREFDEKYNGENSASISPAEREAARKLLEDRLKAELGPERYAEYQRAQDPVYRELYQTAQRNNLPQTKLLEIYDMKRVAEEQRRQLLENQALTPEQKAAGLAALKEETERAIREAMGEQVFRDFQRRGGAWLNNLGSE
jgi:Spy/CpxP family protein refolding chaperone